MKVSGDIVFTAIHPGGSAHLPLAAVFAGY